MPNPTPSDKPEKSCIEVDAPPLFSPPIGLPRWMNQAVFSPQWISLGNAERLLSLQIDACAQDVG